MDPTLVAQLSVFRREIEKCKRSNKDHAKALNAVISQIVWTSANNSALAALFSL